MDENKILNDLTEIKNLMNRSSRFLSLSGFSGIFAGIYALIGAYLAHLKLADFNRNRFRFPKVLETELLLIAFGVLVLSLVTAFWLTYKKARKNNESIFGKGSKNFLFALIIPLIIGGIFILLLLRLKFYVLIAPVTLIFYGISLLFASKYTLGTVKYLAYTEIILGLTAMYFVGNGLIFWAIGFGILHIIYGIVMLFDKR